MSPDFLFPGLQHVVRPGQDLHRALKICKISQDLYWVRFALLPFLHGRQVKSQCTCKLHTWTDVQTERLWTFATRLLSSWLSREIVQRYLTAHCCSRRPPPPACSRSWGSWALAAGRCWWCFLWGCRASGCRGVRPRPHSGTDLGTDHSSLSTGLTEETSTSEGYYLLLIF